MPSTLGLRVLLVHMPMADPVLPNLGVELLAQELRHHGHQCDVLYGTLCMPPIASPQVLHGLVGHAMFSHLYFGISADEIADEIVRALGVGGSVDGVLDEIHQGLMGAEFCLDRCLKAVGDGLYDVVAFSVIFDTQKVPSAALAKALRTRNPNVRILFGGTGCDGAMAPAVLRVFPEVDAVVRGDAEAHIVAICSYLAAGEPEDSEIPPGYVSRLRASEAQPVLASLSARLVPDYNSFVRQWNASPYRHIARLTLLFEGARGCWWGDKHHCKFCGIRAVREGYRQRPATSVLDEIAELQDRHEPYMLYSTDAILSREHMRQLLPAVVELRDRSPSTLRLFFELKSNLSQQEVALLAAAGVVAAQPGIESFSTSTLAAVKKGAKAITQLHTLKWLCAYRIDCIYGLITGIPGETAGEIRAQAALIRRFHHLQPPTGLNPLGLHRFSPYFDETEEHGLTDLRPFSMQRVAYRCGDETLMQLCYELDFASREKDSPEMRAARHGLEAALAQWQAAYSGGERFFYSGPLEATTVTRCTRGTVSIRALSKLESLLIAHLAQPRSVSTLVMRTGVCLADLVPRIESLVDEGLVIFLDERYMALPVPLMPPEWSPEEAVPDMAVAQRLKVHAQEVLRA